MNSSGAGTQPVLSSSFVAASSSTAPPPGGSSFAVGQVVEYYSASSGSWIPAKVLEVHANGTYTLDCKPDVPPDRMRRATAKSKGAEADDFSAGEAVEYFGATQGRWIPAKVTKVNRDGTWDLDCKPNVTREKIRRPASAQYKEGDVVEYFGASQGRWIPAKVLKANANGTYDLDCKPSVLPDKIRFPPVGGPATSGSLGPGGPPTSTSLAATGSGEKFNTGDIVEYFSSSAGKWIPAKVLGVNSNGTYQLDCKPDVPSDKVRRPQAPVGSGYLGSSASVSSLASDSAAHLVGDMVEYYGATKGKWIPAKVTKVHPNGTYDLDCKPGVQPDKIRPVASPQQPGGDPEPEFSAGEVVEYFGASQQKWIRAKVLQVNSAGESYNLDCKPNVPPSRLRKVAPQSALDGSMSSMAPLSTGLLGVDTVRTREALGGSGPLQLVRAERSGSGWRYEVCKEGAAALERHGARRIAVAAFCGAQSSGKGQLLDLLLGPARPAPRAPLQGVWLRGGLEGDEQGPLLTFLDCEGFGARGAECDAQLATLCTMLSSVLVLCSNGELTEDVFEAMAPLCKLEVNMEERGNDASRPALLWVLSNYPSGGQDVADDYLERALHSAGSGSSDQGRKQTARDVRQGLLKFFRQRACAVLPSGTEQVAADALRSHLAATCSVSPKAVGGRPLGCFSFVALLRQLVAAMNDKRILSAKGAWETVQHTACGGLADELRSQASGVLHRLVAGQPLPGGAKLPLTDDALHAVLRGQRRELKSEWEERAIGDEAVRREYWLELKETLGREENLVRAQNARVADQDLIDALRKWEDWLDKDDDQDAQTVDEICGQFGALMERVPAGPLSRAGQQAVQAAARRVSSARGAMETTSQRRANMEREAIAHGERAAHQEGAARLQLDEVRTELLDAQRILQEAEDAGASAGRDRSSLEDELADAKSELHRALASIEAARSREHALKAKHRSLTESASALRGELEQLQSASAKSDAEKLASERCARTAEEVSAIGRSRLEEQLEQARAEARRYEQQLQEERSRYQGESERAANEHRQRVEEVRRQLEEERRVLTGEQERARSEHMRMVEEARRQLDEERVAYAGSLDSQKGRLLERERDTGILEGKSQALQKETESLRERLSSLEEQVRKAKLQLGQQASENEQARASLEDAQADADRARVETGSRLKDEEERYRREMADLEEEVGRKPKCGCSVM